MKSREEIEELKQSWFHDPCWDIEDTEGFEEHRTELIEYRIEIEGLWAVAEQQRKEVDMKVMGITSDATYRYLKSLERRIDALEKD